MVRLELVGRSCDDEVEFCYCSYDSILSVAHAVLLSDVFACSSSCCRGQREEACDFWSIARSLGIPDASATVMF